MGLIHSIHPIEIHIRFNETTGQTDVQMTRELPYPTLVAMLCTIMIQYGAKVVDQLKQAGIVPGATPGDGPVNGG